MPGFLRLLLFPVMLISIIANASSAQETKIAQLKAEPVVKTAETATGTVEENFDTEDLGSHWTINNPDADAFIIEDGQLLLVATYNKDLSDLATATNTLRLNKELPWASWRAIIKVNLNAQTAVESFRMGLFGDKDNRVGVEAYTDWYGNAADLKVSIYKVAKGKSTSFQRHLWRSKVKSNAYGKAAENMPSFQLRLEKRKSSFYGSVKLETDPPSEWIELERLLLLRAKWPLEFHFYQYKKTGGESIAEIDWIKIEQLK